MKNAMKMTMGALSLMFLSTGVGLSQSKTPVTVKGQKIQAQEIVKGFPIKDQELEASSVIKSKHLAYLNESEPSKIEIPVSNEFNFLEFNINVGITQGEILVEIFNPDGEKKGTVTTKSDGGMTVGLQTKAQETANSTLKKTFKHPTKGTWTIKSIPTSATGDVSIGIRQEYNAKLDSLKD